MSQNIAQVLQIQGIIRITYRAQLIYLCERVQYKIWSYYQVPRMSPKYFVATINPCSPSQTQVLPFQNSLLKYSTCVRCISVRNIEIAFIQMLLNINVQGKSRKRSYQLFVCKGIDRQCIQCNKQLRRHLLNPSREFPCSWSRWSIRKNVFNGYPCNTLKKTILVTARGSPPPVYGLVRNLQGFFTPSHLCDCRWYGWRTVLALLHHRMFTKQQRKIYHNIKVAAFPLRKPLYYILLKI